MASLRKRAAMNSSGSVNARWRLSRKFWRALRRRGVHPTRHILRVRVAHQRMDWFQQEAFGHYRLYRQFVVSTSAWGVGQRMNSNQTPLGLHRIADKIGDGHPIGTVFRHRVPVGYLWQGLPEATIVHRILWLDGLEPGFNRGGHVDTHARYIYIHGFGDETTLGCPNSHGCVHLAAKDLIPLFDAVPSGTLVWIEI
jgi:hypothetical protein